MFNSKHHRTVIYASIFSMVSIVIGYCLRYATNLILAKYLKAEAYGDFVFIASIILFIGMALLLGSDEATLAFLPGYLANKSWDKAAGFIKKHLRNIIEISIFSILIGILTTFILMYFVQHGHQNLSKYYPFTIALCLAPLIAVMTFQTKLLRTYNSLFWSLISYNIMPFLLICLGVIATIYFTNWLTIYHAFAIYAASLLLIITIQRLAIKKIAPRNLAIAKPKYLTQDWNKVSRHLLIAELTFVGISSVDLIMLKFLGVDFAEVGIFAAALTICNSIMLVSVAVNIGTAPIISVYMKKYFYDKLRLQRFVNLCNILLIIPTVVLTAVIIIFGHYFLSAFGPAFIRGYWVLVIILISYAISVILGTSFTVLRYTEHQNAIVNSNILALLSMIAIEALLIPYYGYYGAAIGLAFSRIAMAIWFVLVVKKKFGIKPFFIV